ncbi:MAG: DUF3310 domain-containing protein [Succinivibrionaceae bacterium]|nr:DUF3310 domain-containing protein [Succinivibrionaceae bacterium]
MDGSSKQAVDYVNHPPHYQTSSGLETIDVIEAFTEDLKGFEATNTGNVLKYMCRWKSKNGLEDLKKALWYLNRLIDHVEKQQDEEIQKAMHSISSVKCTDDDYKNAITTAQNLMSSVYN